MSQDRGALLENLLFQELRRRGVDAACLVQPAYEVDFLIREDRRVTQLIQVCAGLEKPETVVREYGALYKAEKATHCKELVLLTPDGAAPSKPWVPSGPAGGPPDPQDPRKALLAEVEGEGRIRARLKLGCPVHREDDG